MRGSLIVRAFVALGAFVVTLGLTHAEGVQLAFWDFNTESTAANGGVYAASSSLALVGGTTATFATGSPLDTATTNRAYNTTTYPAQGTNNLTAGILFRVPTTGYTNITVRFDVRWSNTASKYLRFQYTTDGMNWINGPQLVAGGGDQWYSQGPGAGSRFSRTPMFGCTSPGIVNITASPSRIRCDSVVTLPCVSDAPDGITPADSASLKFSFSSGTV